MMTEELTFEERENRLSNLQFENSQIYDKLLKLIPKKNQGKFIKLFDKYVDNEIEQEELCD